MIGDRGFVTMALANPVSIESIRHVHIVGVCGTLMGAFAAFLRRSGKRVTGSDQNVYPPMSDVLREAGVELLTGYRAGNLVSLGGRPDLVVIGNVVSADNAEARAAIDGGYSYSSLPEAMEKLLLRETRNLVVAGTHGKTTTSSLLAHVLVRCGKEPSYFIGGVPQDLPFSFCVSGRGPGGLFVLEGDEYDTAFWDKVPKFNHYLPDDVLLTSIEYDHADIYPDFSAVVRAFRGLVGRIRPGGRLTACLDYPAIRELLPESRVPVTTYGSAAASGARYLPDAIHEADGRTRFTVLRDGRPQTELSLRLPGRHNVLNALAVWIECEALGLDPGQVREAIECFSGVKRRQEVRAEVRGVLVIDDFAHHPTAVRETLAALRARYPGRRLTAVFEPRSATSRRKVFQREYGEAFAGADRIYIARPYDTSRISPQEAFSSEQLVEDLVRRGKNAAILSEADGGVAQVASESRSGDLIAVLSNGGFGGFIPKLVEKLKA
jgi:UDP-N-acetylmuramate: L-alanyl-gamma-D-glutamyl-meso-diaminopimelate ligase